MKEREGKIVTVTLHTGEVVVFNSAGGRYDSETKTIVGEDKENNAVNIKPENIDSMQVSRINKTRTIFVAGGTILALLLGISWLQLEGTL